MEINRRSHVYLSYVRSYILPMYKNNTTSKTLLYPFPTCRKCHGRPQMPIGCITTPLIIYQCPCFLQSYTIVVFYLSLFLRAYHCVSTYNIIYVVCIYVYKKINSKKNSVCIDLVSLTHIAVVNNKFIELYDSSDIISPHAHRGVY